MEKQPNSYDCFVCGVRNNASVRVAFYDSISHDGSPEVLARFTARTIHQGYPGRIHGGVATGVLDEVIGRAINSNRSEETSTVWGVAVELTTKFHMPVPLETELTARGRITRERRRLFEGTGEIYTFPTAQLRSPQKPNTSSFHWTPSRISTPRSLAGVSTPTTKSRLELSWSMQSPSRWYSAGT